MKHRLVGVGVLTRDQAADLGCVGPMMRASGISRDTRTLGYAAYGYVDFAPIVETDGDSYARCAVRIRELFQSVDIIAQAAAKIPAGEIGVKVSGYPGRRVSLPLRAAARRGDPLREGGRDPLPAALPGAHADVCQHPRAGEDAAGLRAGRRAGARPHHRPLHQLHGEVGMSVFGMSRTIMRNLFSRPATRLYPTREKEPHRRRAQPRAHRERHRGVHLLQRLRQALPHGRHHRAEGRQGMEHRPPALLHLQRVRRGVPQEVPDDGQPLHPAHGHEGQGHPAAGAAASEAGETRRRRSRLRRAFAFFLQIVCSSMATRSSRRGSLDLGEEQRHEESDTGIPR